LKMQPRHPAGVFYGRETPCAVTTWKTCGSFSALWIGLALLSSLVSIRLAISVALIEIVVGALAGNLVGLTANTWVSYLAGVGSVLLTFLAGAEIDPAVIKSISGPAC